VGARLLQPRSMAGILGHQAAPAQQPLPRNGGHLVACTAWRMTRVTTPGSEIIDRCGACTSVMWACARLAMASCNAGGMAWSAVPTTAQDGMVFQAGTPVGLGSAVVAIGARMAGWERGR